MTLGCARRLNRADHSAGAGMGQRSRSLHVPNWEQANASGRDRALDERQGVRGRVRARPRYASSPCGMPAARVIWAEIAFQTPSVLA